MPVETPREITRLLAAWRAGDSHAGDQVFSVLYDELRRLAHHALADQHNEATLQTTGLVNELYLRLIGNFRPAHADRRRFFAAAAKVMRRILVDRARERLAEKRGRGERPLPLDDEAGSVRGVATDALEMERALSALERHDARLGEIVELRFFAGLSVEETAEILEVSPRTVKRDWQRAKGLLADWLGGAAAP